MHVLIVESRKDLAQCWACHLRSCGFTVHVAHGQSEAVHHLQAHSVQVMMLDLMLDEGSALAVADFAGFKQPCLKVMFLTDTSVFSDGSIFRHCANACVFLPAATPVEDLAAIAEHYGRAA